MLISVPAFCIMCLFSWLGWKLFPCPLPCCDELCDFFRMNAELYNPSLLTWEIYASRIMSNKISFCYLWCSVQTTFPSLLWLNLIIIWIKLTKLIINENNSIILCTLLTYKNKIKLRSFKKKAPIMHATIMVSRPLLAWLKRKTRKKGCKTCFDHALDWI